MNPVQDNYTIRRHAQIKIRHGRMHKYYIRKAFPKGRLYIIYLTRSMGSTSILDEDPNFIDLAIELASVLRHTIFLDQVIS